MKHNWETLREEAEAEGPYGSIAAMASQLGLPYGTVYDALKRGDLPAEQIIEAAEIGSDSQKNGLTFDEDGNEATLKFRGAEPLSKDEVLALAKVDTNEWKVTDTRFNLWQVGRKHTIKDLRIKSGTMSGSIMDDGEIKKEYLYQIEVKLTRIKRIAVKPVIKPVEVNFTSRSYSVSKRHCVFKSILFVTDPHFGFRRQLDGELTPMHHRKFLSGVLGVAAMTRPDVVLWAGDMLDMADFSSFKTEPELLFNVQLAGIETSWLLSQFGETCDRQIVLEGNHDERLNRALIQNMKSAYQIRPVDELDGPPLMSVPRFLGLSGLDIEWVGGYPDSQVRIGSIKFMHGKIARKGSAKTVGAMIDSAACSKIFGHIHRYELASKYIADTDEEVFVGSPGCACERTQVPGAGLEANWQLGAFFITIFNDGSVANIEHIRGDKYGEVLFRGEHIVTDNYFADFIEHIPEEYRRQFNG